MKKKFAIVFLSLCLVLSLPFAAHANIVTATGRYLITAVKHVAGGAKVTATNTATGAKHVATHGVSAPALGFAIGAGLVAMGTSTGVGLAFQAITGLALDAVDWVMDEENNRIKYTNKSSSPYYTNQYTGDTRYPSFTSACASSTAIVQFGAGSYVKTNDGIYCVYWSVDNNQDIWIIITGNVPATQYLNLDTLAEKVIEQADAGQVDSQKTIENYVTHLAKQGKLDNELDNSTDITKPDGTEPDDPTKPNDKECPAGTVLVGEVCVEKSETDTSLWCDSTDFSKKICDWIDWTQVKHDEPETDAGKVDVIDKSKDLNIDRDRIDFINQCPAPTPINTSVGGFPVSTELNYQPLCDFFTMLNPFVIGMGGISSALIIAGGARRG